jgi:hypothetical protein
MTDTTFKQFSYHLLHAIRDNKKPLIDELPAATLSNEEFAQREPLRRLINAMFQFEKFARGAQPALASVYEAKHFTLKASRTDLHPYSDCLNFVNKAGHMANHVVKLMVDCQGLLVGPIWQEFLSMKGTHPGGFRDIVHELIRQDLLPKLVEEFPGFSAYFPSTGVLKMGFRKGAAVKNAEQFFVVIIREGKTIQEQIDQVNRLCAEIIGFARAAAENPANWPSEEELLELERASREQEAFAAEAKEVHVLMAEIYQTLRPEQKALLQRHPSEVARFVAYTE